MKKGAGVNIDLLLNALTVVVYNAGGVLKVKDNKEMDGRNFMLIAMIDRETGELTLEVQEVPKEGPPVDPRRN